MSTTLALPLNSLVANTVSVESSGRLGFLDLPFEIRLAIYSYLFDASKLSCGIPHTSWPSCGLLICACLFPHHIVRTCRQLREEAFSPLMAATTVEVAGSLDKILDMPASYVNAVTKAIILDAKQFSMRPFQLERLPSLRVLEIRNITVWCKFYDEVYLESKEANDPMYHMIMFNIKRISANLFQLCAKPRSFSVHLAAQFVVNSLSDETIHATIDVDTGEVLHRCRGAPMKDMNQWSGYY